MKTTFMIAVLALTCFAAQAATLTTLVSFNGNDGAQPKRGVIADAVGNLYGTTYSGGAFNAGTAFRIEAETSVLDTLAVFNSGNGAMPRSSLIADIAGNLYGTTSSGGAFGYGTVFRVEAGTNALTTLVEFDWSNGAEPYAGLVVDPAGNLYGTTRWGGTLGGTVFRIEAGTNTLTTLADISGLTDGLIIDDAGNLQGTKAGYMDDSTIFRIEADTNLLTTIVEFQGADGTPHGGLVADAVGNLYGTTIDGGVFGAGTVFRVEADTNVLTTLVEFDGLTNGAYPVGGVIIDAAGNLYGTTSHTFTGSSGTGTVFRVEAGTNALTTLVEFHGFDGAEPRGSLIADAAGNLYGTTEFGGVFDAGTVFRISETGFVVVEPIPGDFDNDGDVDGRDFLAWQRNTSLGSLAEWQIAYDEQNNLLSLSSIPEPGALVLVSACGVLVLARRGQRTEVGGQGTEPICLPRSDAPHRNARPTAPRCRPMLRIGARTRRG